MVHSEVDFIENTREELENVDENITEPEVHIILIKLLTVHYFIGIIFNLFSKF
jgi:hypothetical protein